MDGSSRGDGRIVQGRWTDRPGAMHVAFIADVVVLIAALSSGKDVCQAVDHGCEHLCVSSGESYVCKCLEGFRLAEDGKHCRSK